MRNLEKLRLVVIMVLLLTSIVGFVYSYSRRSGEAAVTFDQGKSTPSQVVYISGAVQEAGVYEVRQGETLGSVVSRAGGFRPEADLSYINLELNLAAEVRTGEHILVPFASAGSDMEQIQQATGIMSGVSLNSATKDQLMSLPGVGEVLAASIISARPFGAVADLQQVKGIGDAKYSQLLPLVQL